MIRKLLAGLVLAAVLAACGGTAPVTVQCPADSTCDVNVQAPPMPPSQISYYQQNPSAAYAAGMTDSMLEALILQDMMWRNCWNCYGPTYYSRYGYYSTYTPAQRTTVIQQNTTVINNNKTVITKVAANPPAAAKAVEAPKSNQPPASVAKPVTTSPAPAPKPASPAPVSVPRTTTSGAGGGSAGGSSFKK